MKGINWVIILRKKSAVNAKEVMDWYKSGGELCQLVVEKRICASLFSKQVCCGGKKWQLLPRNPFAVDKPEPDFVILNGFST